MTDSTASTGFIDESSDDPYADLRPNPPTALSLMSKDPNYVPKNSFADACWPWPELFDGFEEFVKKSREESAKRRGPPPWW